MAIRIAMNVICDRCLKPYEQKTLEYGEAVPEVARKKLIVMHEGYPDSKGEIKQDVIVTYEDLCPQCEGVVEKAISKIKMDAAPTPATPKKRKKRNGVTTSVKEEPPKEEPPKETKPEEKAEEPSEVPPVEASDEEQEDEHLF